MNILITQATSEDVRGITEVLYKTWLATYPNPELGITPDDIEAIYKDIRSEEGILKRAEDYKNIPANQKRVIAKDGELVVGVAALVQNTDTNQLRMVYVLPEYQGQGIGTQLWEAVKGFRDQRKDTIVQVADYNQPAINFYTALGFVDTGKRWQDEKWRMKSGACIPEMEMVLRKEGD